jgi:signal transduction histidine kinase/CheY-like chemotaxis protein
MAISKKTESVPSWLLFFRNLYRGNTEFAQSVVRFPVGVLAASYFYFAFGRDHMSVDDMVDLSKYIFGYSLLATIVVFSIAKWPGVFWFRRLFTINLDYWIVAKLMALGGAAVAPLLAVFIWITVGNGLRFGGRYLLLALTVALVSSIIAMAHTPFWRSQPQLCAMFILALLVSSVYPFTLSSRLNAAERAARLANAEKSRYLAQASHDLRQPIHSIGLLAAQLDEDDMRPATRAIVERIEQAVHNATEMLQAFLDASVIESGTLAPHPEIVNVSALFRDIERQTDTSAKWAGNEIRFATTGLSVHADRSFLGTILQNLISNAVKYAPGRRILVGCRKRGDTVALFVMDQGAGIAEEHLAKIKEPFFRTPGAAKSMTEGVGLGLAIVHRLSEIAGWQFDLSSVEGRGTVATVLGLPLLASNDGIAATSMILPIGRLTGMEIMLIEDDAVTREATATILLKWGCHVQALASPPSSLDRCEAIVSDFQLADGKTLADFRSFLDLVRASRTPLIMISGNDPKEIKGALKRTDLVILAKPFRPAELRSVLMATKLSGQD